MFRLAFTGLTMMAYAQATPFSLLSRQDNKPFKGPLTDQNFADPAVLKADDTYYAYSTRSKGVNVPIATSQNFLDWKVVGNALPSLPDWAGKGDDKSVWAPDVVRTDNNKFVLYFTSALASEDKRCVGAAAASSASGPFQPSGNEPLICTPKASTGTVIDPSGFVDPATKNRYILYRLRDPTDRIMLQRLSADGLSKDNSQPVELLRVGPNDGGVTEAPSMILSGDTYVLFYSTHAWNSLDYTISVATSKKLDGGFQRRDKPLLDTESMQKLGGGKQVSPGGATVLAEGTKGEDGGEVFRMVFHAAGSKDDVEDRKLYVGGVQVKGGDVTLAVKGWQG